MTFSKHAALVTGLTVLLGGSGTLHLIRPQTFDGIVPKSLPGEARTWTYLSGVAELVTAAALATPRTRRLGGTLAALLFVAVFPANIRMARSYLRSSKTTPTAKAIAVVRLPLQIPLVLAGLAVRRGAWVHATLDSPGRQTEVDDQSHRPAAAKAGTRMPARAATGSGSAPSPDLSSGCLKATARDVDCNHEGCNLLHDVHTAS